MAYTAWHTFVSGETLTAAQLNALQDNLKAMHPVGSFQYLMRAATTVETLVDGVWLECNGVAVSRTTYSALQTVLSALSYPFGSGNGTTTMNLPDLQGRVLVAMAASGHADVNGLGDSDGLTKTSRTPKGTVSSTVSGTTSSVSVPASGLTITGSGGTSSYDQDSPDATAWNSLGTLAVGGAATAAAGTFSGSGSGSVPGDFLVGGAWFIKALT
jgi:microcystin-dependent protein